MALTNRERVGRAVEHLGPALDAFITRVLAGELQGDGSWVDVARIADNAGVGKEYSATDPQLSLRFIANNLPAKARRGWYPFTDYLNRTQQSYVAELIQTRNDFAHNKPFENEDAQRALDTAERLLRAVGAPDAAEAVRKEKVELAKVANDRFDRAAARTSSHVLVASDALPAWREVITPHRDVIEGKFHAAEFAADLYTVYLGTAEGEYGDPAQFFARTFLTAGLRKLLSDSARRLSGDRNAPPVVNLQTNFGGGKTHSMLALWHLASGTPVTAYPDEVQSIVATAVAEAGRDTLPRSIQRVALVGNQLQAAQADPKRDGTVVNTLWGELAHQLGGAEAYALVADADRSGTNPGAALRELLALYSPAIILIDEWVAYARQLVTAKSLPGGSFDTQFTFAQTLTEAANATPGVQLVVSLPTSERSGDATNAEEVGGEYGAEALNRLKNIVGRTADQWRPASSEESFEIVRRRLFEPADATTLSAIGAIAKTTVDYYRKYNGDFPSDTTDPDYADRIRRSYPIHPELFDRLYSDWSTLDRFQRTRGVLRLMNAIVGRL
ncbi:Swt1 family HEPN domain-containing protein [Tsukamurella soli]|uniref:Swt1-like HEPN domain-containing protein n=1 Tax=Tsukamurella soli TaxID=644556 RepID=A0ABP8K3Q3_9ACTN